MNAKEYFDNIARDWNGIRSQYFDDKIREEILKNIDVENKVIGDLGCGTGFISLGLASKKSRVVFAIDQSENMLKEVKEESIRQKFNNIYPIKSTLDELVLFDELLDGITINMALHHMVNPRKTIKEMYRVLKSKGKLVICDVCKHNGEWAKVEMHDEWLGFNENEIIGWLQDANFKDISIEDTKFNAVAISSKGETTETKIFLASAIKE